ncbi:tetratricopeptide repeat protein [Winogradskyella alexanderae]|uniref:Tetratricopeptide repeat protein n=1 Tax=Winogradskyella alexanderae TaxID=2877123 RepID=A0ABS7XRU8_9FLAO|nr:tetratricopeptide repeat protein [Winogradskyella alexanderae]MCA0132752.1 tetratricopeptide repeat protein [Winogradskyella alexanderae]
MKPPIKLPLNMLLWVFIALFYTQTRAQDVTDTKEWQEDLRFLQNTINNKYPFLFKKVTSETFNSEVEKFHDAIPNMEQHEILVGFERIVSLFKYGHTRVGNREGVIDYHKLPVNLYHFKDGIYIEGVHKSHEAILGGKLLKIEGVPVEEALRRIKPAFPAENDQWFKAYGTGYLAQPEMLHAQGVTKKLKQTITYTVVKDGNTFDYDLSSFTPERGRTRYGYMKQEGEWLSSRNQEITPLYLKHLDKIYYYEYLPEEKAVYVRHSQIQDDPSEDIPTFYAKLFDFIESNDVEKLIIDVRLNGGGNNYKNKPIVTGIIKSEKINKPGHLFVIIGRRTFSACQNLINELDNYTNVVFVGEPSGENINFYGDNRRVMLPNSKLPVYLSFAWWQDKPQWENEDWTAPHAPVEMTFTEYSTNQDPVLQKALDFETEGFVLDPMGHLTNLFMSGQMERVKQEALAMIQDERYAFVDFEDQFNRAAYNMIGGEQNQGAIFVLQLTTQAFPKSELSWKNLGDALRHAENYEQAKACYMKVIELNPDSPQAKSAKSTLDKMRKE